MAEKNHYQVLQVDPSAGQDIITAAYKQLAKAFHPDVNPSPEANRAMQRINLAYQVLSDPLQRARYDRELQEQRESQNSTASQDDLGYSEPRTPGTWSADVRDPFRGAGTGVPAGGARTPEWLRRERERTKRWWGEEDRPSRERGPEKPKGAIRWGWAILYVIFASALFLILGLQTQSIEGVIAFLLVTLILFIPIVFRLDEISRK